MKSRLARLPLSMVRRDDMAAMYLSIQLTTVSIEQADPTVSHLGMPMDDVKVFVKRHESCWLYPPDRY